MLGKPAPAETRIQGYVKRAGALYQIYSAPTFRISRDYSSEMLGKHR